MEPWTYDKDLWSMASGLKIIYADIEAHRRSSELEEELHRLRRRVSAREDGAAEELEKFMWSNFGIDTLAIMCEIHRLVSEIPKEAWLIYRSIGLTYRQQYEEERE